MNNMFLSGTIEGPIWYTIPYQSTYWLLNRGGTLKNINQPNSGFFERIFDVANNQLKFSTDFKGQ